MISHAGTRSPFDELVLPVAGQHLPVERSDGQIQALLEEGGEGRVGAAEVGVALAERPDGAGQPVRGAGVGRDSVSPRGWAWG